MGFLSWIFGESKSAQSAARRAAVCSPEERGRTEEQRCERELAELSKPDPVLAAAQDKQLAEDDQAEPVARAGRGQMDAAAESLKGLLDALLERIRRSREEERPICRFSIGRLGVVGRDPCAAIREIVRKNKTLGRLLVKYVNERCDGYASRCYQRAGVSRQLYSQIISNPDKVARKRTVMQLAIGLQLDRAEADQFLAAAGYAFSPSDYEDQVFAWCLANGVYSLFDITELLVKGACEPVPIN